MKIKLLTALAIILLAAGCSPVATDTPAPVPTVTAAPGLPPVAGPDLLLFNMIDAQSGWGLTATQVLRTFDGGVNWYDVTPEGLTAVGFAPFFALDVQTFWLLIPDPNQEKASILYRTYDGGKTWDAFEAPLGTALFQFLDAKTGFAMSDLGAGAGSQAVAILETDDGGATWKILFAHQGGIEQDLPFSGQKYGISYSDPSHAWVGGNVPMMGYIYFYGSQDGGRTWSYQDIRLPDTYREFFTGVNPPIFFSETEGLLPVDLYGSSYSRIFYRTTDGGATWTPGERIISIGLYSPISFETIFVWTGSSKLYVSRDSGQTWQTVGTNVDISETLFGMQFADENTGWALTSSDGVETTLYKTTDGGATWSIIIP